ncbi:MAG: hypothetical protein ABWX84_15765 [Nocardioides sp.]
MIPHSSPAIRAQRVVFALLVALAVLSPAVRGDAAASDLAANAPTASSVSKPAARVPARCASNGDYVWNHLRTCGWAASGNTGPRSSACPNGRLVDRGTVARSVHRIRRDGAVVACRDFLGCLSIEARNVTVRDVRVRCTSGKTGESANGTGVITIHNGASAKLTRVRTDGMKGVHACVWHAGTRATITKLDCSGVDDGVFSWANTAYSKTTGDNVTLRDSYLHGFTTRTANGHVDGYQTVGSSHGVIAHNTFKMTTDDGNWSTSAVAIWNAYRSSRDFVVRGNLIAGGGFSIYAQDYDPSAANPEGGFSVTDTHFTDNVFSRRLFGCVGSYGVWFPRGAPTDRWNRSGNKVLETGQRIDARNPTYQGRTCN